MQELSRIISGLPASPTITINDKAKALRAAGEDVIVLAGGEPDFDTPDYIIAAAFAAIEDGATHYAAPSKGISPVLEAIAAKMDRDYGIQVDPMTQVIVAPGGKWALNLALQSMLNPGDEVLILEPAWVSYPTMVALAGGTPVSVPLASEDNFLVTSDMLRAKITPKTKAMIVNSPSNPTGRVLTQDEIDAVVKVAVQADLYVISDEIYEKIIFDGRQHISLAAQDGMQERTITVNGLSKAYAMTGWRFGWLVAPAPIIKNAGKLNSQTVTSAATFTMHAAAAALNGPQDAVSKMCQAYKERRDFVVSALNEMDGVECRSIEGAFYIFPRFPNSQRNSMEIAEFLLDEAKIAGVPGIAFGEAGEGHVRFSIATAMSDLEQLVERMGKIASDI